MSSAAGLISGFLLLLGANILWSKYKERKAFEEFPDDPIAQDGWAGEQRLSSNNLDLSNIIALFFLWATAWVSFHEFLPPEESFNWRNYIVHIFVIAVLSLLVIVLTTARWFLHKTTYLEFSSVGFIDHTFTGCILLHRPPKDPRGIKVQLCCCKDRFFGRPETLWEVTAYCSVTYADTALGTYEVDFTLPIEMSRTQRHSIKDGEWFIKATDTGHFGLKAEFGVPVYHHTTRGEVALHGSVGI